MVHRGRPFTRTLYASEVVMITIGLTAAVLFGFWYLTQWMDREQAKDAIRARAKRKALEIKRNMVR